MPGAAPLLTIQTASLYASNNASTFTGSGGPFGFSPFTSQFGGIISSAGLAADPFNDTVYTVATGDEVEFVIAIQNLGAASAYGIDLKDVMPTGFVVPADGIGLTVTDGLGNDLATSGNLFGAGGLTITPALPAYDPNSGQNVDLVTFSLDAGTALPGPYANLASTASIASYSATAGGINLATANPASAATTVVTAAPTPIVTPETDPSAVAAGQTISFDVSVAIPTGTLNNVTIGSVMPTGADSLSLVSASVISVGAGLQAGTPTVAANGTINFGTITHSATATGDNTINARITVKAAGNVSGTATLQTVVSAAAPSAPGGAWTASVSSSVGVVAPPPPPTLTGVNGGLVTEIGTILDPYASLSIADSNPNQVGAIAISLQQGTLGQLATSRVTGVTYSLDPTGTTFYATGTLANLQAAAQALQFIPGAAGNAQFIVTVVDAAGGVAQNASTAVSIVPQDPLFNAAYYLAQNPDVAAVGCDPYQHYLNFGWKEGRDPNPYFDTNFYLKQNPDVAAAGVDPLLHFENFGWAEGRQPSLVFNDAQYNAVYTDVAAAHVDPLLHYIQFGQHEGRMSFIAPGTAAADPLINTAYYDKQLGATLDPTGTAAAQQAAYSYATTGWQQGLNPDQFFNTAYYLAHNPDVAAAHVDPLLHYELFGWKEGRNPSALFDTNAYLNANPDVKAAGVDPLLHYVQYGQAEGRAIFAAPS
jgi:uncharacterized repeat protein (TIGR01451 family)